MSIDDIIFAFIFFGVFLSAILYVLFGQLKVRKLRKNPKTKDALGLEYASGWDIINVAQALAFPRSWSRTLAKSPLSFLHTNADVLYENTSKFDQILGAIFYWLLTISGLSGVLLVLLNSIGVFE